MQLPLMIFDMDGVLVDSEMLANTVFSEKLAVHGVPLSPEAAASAFRGRTLADCVAWVAATHGVTLPDDFIADLQVETFARFRTDLQPISYVKDVLAQLRTPYCLASSSRFDKITLSLAVTGLDEFFPEAHRFSAEQVERGKPAPDLFLFAAAKMNYEPKNWLVVEDSPAGVTAARRAGMVPMGFAPARSGMQDPLVKAGGIVFSDMRSLLAMIDGIWANILFARGQ